MSRRSNIVTVIAGLFGVVNVGGAGFAIATGEFLHAAVHAGLALLAYAVWRVERAPAMNLPGAQQTDDRLEHLQQSVDAIALEVERIGEAQRFLAQIEAERGSKVPARQSPSERTGG